MYKHKSQCELIKPQSQPANGPAGQVTQYFSAPKASLPNPQGGQLLYYGGFSHHLAKMLLAHQLGSCMDEQKAQVMQTLQTAWRLSILIQLGMNSSLLNKEMVKTCSRRPTVEAVINSWKAYIYMWTHERGVHEVATNLCYVEGTEPLDLKNTWNI